MSDLNFTIQGAAVAQRAMSPLLSFEMELTNTPASEQIHSGILQCRIYFEAPRRSYNDREKEKLRELFGRPERWGETLRSMPWTQTQVMIPSFTGVATVDLPVPCTFDMNVKSTKYLYGLEEGDVSLSFLFSGSVFYAAEDGRLQTSRIPHSKEARYKLPVHQWRELMEGHFPNASWLYVRRDVFDRLYAYKRDHGLPTWEHTLERLLEMDEAANKPQETNGVAP